MKKLKNIIITLLLVFVSVPTVFAAITPTSTGTIDLSGIKEEVTVTAYRLMSVKVDSDTKVPQNPVYSWIDDGKNSVADWVATNYSDYIDTENGTAVTEAFNKDLTNTIEIAKFYDDLAKAIADKAVEISEANTKSIQQTSGTGSDKIENVEMGNYLIIIKNGPKYVYNPSSVNVVPVYDENNGWNVSEPNKVVIKYTNPQIEKTTTDNKTEKEAKIGDTVPYTITVDVPNFKMNAAAKNITIKDTLSRGLTYNTDIKVYGVKGTTKELLTAVTNYTLDTTGSETFKVSFDATQYENTFRLANSAELKYDQIVIEYSATVNENAVTGTDTENKAVLEYSNNPENATEVGTDNTVVKVFTYNIKVNKVDENQNALPGAKFSVRKGSKDSAKLSFVKVDNGIYRLATTNDTNTTQLLEVHTENGTLEIRGLDSGTYVVTEEEAPNGYVKLQNPKEFIIKDADAKGVLDGKIEGSENNTLEGTIANTKGFTLPVTGGIGTIIFSIVGILFMAIGAFLVRSLLKKNEA